MKNFFKKLIIGIVAGLAIGTFASGATILFPGGGGTGTNSVPTLGQILAGNGAGIYTTLSPGSNGQVLSADNTQPSGLKWVTGGGGGTPGGSNTQIQFNNSGSFGGDSNFTWDSGSQTFTVNGEIQGSAFIIGTSGFTLESPSTSIHSDDTNLYFNASSGNFIEFGNPSSGNYAKFDTSLINTSDKTFTFPNKSGTFALISDLTSGTVTSVGSADGSITISNPTTTPDLSVVSAPTSTTATTASNVVTNLVSNNVSYFPLLAPTAATAKQTVDVGSNMTFNPSTNTLTTTTFSGALSGNATTASTLATPRLINGVSFNGSADITVTAAAGTLTGTTLASNVVASSLTSVGTLNTVTITGPLQLNGNLDVSAQATSILMKDNTNGAFQIGQGGNDYMAISTVDGSETVTFDLPVGTTTGGNANIFSSNGLAHTINLGDGTGQDIINIGTGGTTADQINIGTAATQNTIAIGSQSTTGLSLTNNNWYIDVGGAASFTSETVNGSLRILEGGSSPSFFTAFQGGDQAGNITYTLPTALPGSNMVLQSDTGGTLSWVSQSGGSQTPWTSDINGGGFNLTNVGGASFASVSTTGNVYVGSTGTGLLTAGGLDFSAQATNAFIKDNTASAYTIKQAGNSYFDITTTDNSESMSLDLPAGASSGTANLFTSNISKTINIGTGTAADTINIGTGGTTPDFINIGTAATGSTITIGSASTTGLSLTDDNWNVAADGGSKFASMTTTNAILVNGIGNFASTISVGSNGGTTGLIKLNGTTSGVVSLTAAAAAGTYTFTLPSDAGVSTYTLQSNGSGTTSWQNSKFPTYTVGASGADFTTIQAALNACTSGANIYLLDNTYNQGGTGLLWKGSHCNIYGRRGTTTITFTGATTLFKTNAPASLFTDNGVNDVIITADGNTSGVVINFSDMSHQNYTNLVIDNVGTGIVGNDTQNTTFYNYFENVQITTLGVAGVNLVSTNPVNDNIFTNIFTGCSSANCIGAEIRNGNNNKFYGFRAEPSTTTGTVGIKLFDAASGNGTFDNEFYGSYIEANGKGIQINATLGSSGGVTRNTFFGGIADSDSVADIIDNGTDTEFYNFDNNFAKLTEMQNALVQTPDNGTAFTATINTPAANITTGDTFISFNSSSGQVGSITGTAVSGTIIYNTFTGSHFSTLINKIKVKIGDLVLATGTLTDKFKHLSQSELSCTRGSQRVYGVYGGTDKAGNDNILSIGTGTMRVANKGENIKVGDLLMSSDVCGAAEKQKARFLGFLWEKTDNIVGSVTAGKAMENIVWKPGEKERTVAVIYMGG